MEDGHTLVVHHSSQEQSQERGEDVEGRGAVEGLCEESRTRSGNVRVNIVGNGGARGIECLHDGRHVRCECYGVAVPQRAVVVVCRVQSSSMLQSYHQTSSRWNS